LPVAREPEDHVAGDVQGLFFTETGHPTPLWGVTWGKINTFLPGLRVELFPDWEKRPEAAAKKAAQEDGNIMESDAAEVPKNRGRHYLFPQPDCQ